MSARATVLIPTFNHGATLHYSVASVLQQTVEEFELFVVGDGVSDVTRAIVEKFVQADSRVRFFDNPKGPRHGEIHRARALTEAEGDIVCYLADDDLWTPLHLTAMLGWLAGADFAHTLPLRVEPDQTLAGWTINLEDSRDREFLLGGRNRIPLACSGHTLAAYRRLPFGWRTTPPDVYTDLYMFQQFLAEPEMLAVSGTKPTCLHFPSPQRTEWSIENRCAELEDWFARVSDPVWCREVLPELALTVESRGWANAEAELRLVCQTIATRSEPVEESVRELKKARDSLDSVQRRLASLEREAEVVREESRRNEAAAEGKRRQLETVTRQLEGVREELGSFRRAIYSSATWRLRRRLLRLPFLAGILRGVARLLAR